MGLNMKVVCVILVLMVASASPQKQKYCGRRLAAMIAHLCSEQSAANMVKRNLLEGYPPVEYDWPWLEPKLAVSFGRGKRQIIAECCENPCSNEELLAYCPDK